MTSILNAVEEEAARIRAEARAEAEAEIERARLQADRLLQDRRQRIAELSDELIEKTDAILGRLDDAEPIYTRFDRLIRALGEAADKLAAESGDVPAPSTDDSRPSSGQATEQEQPEEEPYVAPRSSSFWRAARSGSGAVPPPMASMPRRGQAVEGGGRPANLDAARASAFQLASRGASPQEVENHLRLMHDLDDPSELLAETFAALEGQENRREQI